jgi:hypothetical protein
VIHAGNSSADEDAAQDEITFTSQVTGNLTHLTRDEIF